MVILNHNDWLIGYFYDRALAEEVLDELRRNGFRDDQLRAALCDAELQVAPATRWRRHGAGIGLGLGLVLGGLTGLVGGLGGGLITALVMAAAIFGGFGLILGVLVGWAIDSEEFMDNGPAIRLSRGIVTVRPDGRDTTAAAILRRYVGCEPNPLSLRALRGPLS